MVRLQLRASVFSQGYQSRVRIKIRDFEAQEFASLAVSPGSRSEPNEGPCTTRPPNSEEKQSPNNLEAHNCAVRCPSQDCIITFMDQFMGWSREGAHPPPVFPALPANPSGVTSEASCERALQMFYLLCVRSVTRMQKVSQTAAAA
jgi:hypothetical protein